MQLLHTLTGILDRYNKTVKFQFDNPKEFIVNTISNAVKVSGAIKSITITADYIEIEIRPTVFDAAAARGFIKMQLISFERNNITNVVCQIVPTSVTPNKLFLLTIMLFVWTLVGLLFSHDLYSVFAVIFGWMMMAFVLHFTQKLNQGKLESYLRYILESTKLSKHNRFA